MSETILLGMPKRKPLRAATRSGRSYFVRTYG